MLTYAKIIIPHDAGSEVKILIYIVGRSLEAIKNQLKIDLSLPACDREILMYTNKTVDLNSLTEISLEEARQLKLDKLNGCANLVDSGLMKVANIDSKVIFDKNGLT